MKFIDEYRNRELCDLLVAEIIETVDRPIRLMEVCGTHTMAISRNGIREMLPPQITLISGPGCPVCVTAQSDIDRCIELAQVENVIITTFGDLMRVPGGDTNLQSIRAQGADVRMVYSTLDCLAIAEREPEKQVVFLGVGFETTAPTVAAAILQARQRSIHNFSVLSMHKIVPPALHALMQHPDVTVDGFICPGHVSVIIGANAYLPIVTQYHVPCVITGFEPADILDGILKITQQLQKQTTRVDVSYRRAVFPDGNKRAVDVMFQVFEIVDTDWRGIGMIPGSGLKINSNYQEYDASLRFKLSPPKAMKATGCRCGDILIGKLIPPDCRLFASRCNPQHPIGPCMVSSEGTCAAYYKYHR
ncbi:hydrogenase formation protein HypD [candidate division KSB1 bacterium]|nr:hydrogenase formation protein HypD [candidate division KSB1 bacterium]